MSDLLDELVDRAEAEELLTAANDHFATTRDEQHAEIDAWDVTVADGLPGT